MISAQSKLAESGVKEEFASHAWNCSSFGEKCACVHSLNLLLPVPSSSPELPALL